MANPAGVLAVTDHRPRPLPARSWLVAQCWHELLFAHWPVPLRQLRRVVPPQLTIDTFDDRAWLGVVAFRISDIHLRGLPSLPGVASFPEVNLRTYVRLAMAIARPWFRLPYHYADTRLGELSGDGTRVFSSRSPTRTDFCATYRPVAPAQRSEPTELETWLTERYCYYTMAADATDFVGSGQPDRLRAFVEAWQRQPLTDSTWR
jgi:uncharacterized protein